MLFLDSDGAPVVAELKRGEAPDTVDLQALKYAVYCSQLTVKDLTDAYARYHELDKKPRRRRFSTTPPPCKIANCARSG